jgi:diaminohydroxyphosphoribosylaminopyrimidine deaminase/5-amino-6-(5-phosphoribosylamino)uracil reductase
MAMLDPNPRVAGRGRAELEAAGIRTEVGEHEQEARALNEVFVHWIRRGTPFVIVKYAMSLDGKTATRTGASQWISGEAARRHTHALRNEVGAILVGANTVLADNPQLTTRLPQADVHHPLRVVLDSRGRIPHTARIFDPALPGTTLLATTSAISERQRELLSGQGVDVLVLPAVPSPATEHHLVVSLPALLGALGDRQVSSLLVEGGATVLGAFFDQALVNKVMAFIAPIVIGGREAPGAVGGQGVEQMEQAIKFERVSVERLGTDLLLTGYPAQERGTDV